MRPFTFVISQADDFVVSASGIALAGALLDSTALRSRLASLRLGHKRRLAVPHADAVFAMIGLLVKGKPDIEAIREHGQDAFFRRALSLVRVPSEATLRQRLDQLAGSCEPLESGPSRAVARRSIPVRLIGSETVVRGASSSK